MMANPNRHWGERLAANPNRHWGERLGVHLTRHWGAQWERLPTTSVTALAAAPHSVAVGVDPLYFAFGLWLSAINCGIMLSSIVTCLP